VEGCVVLLMLAAVYCVLCAVCHGRGVWVRGDVSTWLRVWRTEICVEIGIWGVPMCKLQDTGFWRAVRCRAVRCTHSAISPRLPPTPHTHTRTRTTHNPTTSNPAPLSQNLMSWTPASPPPSRSTKTPLTDQGPQLPFPSRTASHHSAGRHKPSPDMSDALASYRHCTP
jgi:hypothetical protein